MYNSKRHNPFLGLLVIIFIGITVYFENPNIRWMHGEEESKQVVIDYYEEKRLKSNNPVGFTIIKSVELIGNKYYITWVNPTKKEDGKVIINNKGKMKIIHENLKE